MTDIVIRGENLSKKFTLGTDGGVAYHRLSEAVSGVPRMLWQIGCSIVARSGRQQTVAAAKKSSDFWALQDVSFEIQRGEIVGVIGRNGAGKSTLLKILSRITEPTSGRFGLRGRVASLLEVGTGFHPELTGLENIHLSGTVLGMTRAEIRERFQEIVEFSGVENFLDTPIKHYSSGMQVRLGFAVAAHLDSEILIIDEVLAVGDAEFQKKCLSKLRSLHRDGRTVICVSHDMSMMSSLCDRVILLEQGRVAFNGDPSTAVLQYHHPSSQEIASCYEPAKIGKQVGDERASLQRLWLENSIGKLCQKFDLSEPIIICMEYTVKSINGTQPYPNFHIHDQRGEHVFVTANRFGPEPTESTHSGRYIARCIIPGDFLNTGTFSIGAALTFTDKGLHVSFYERSALMLHVTENLEVTLDGARLGYAGPIPGVVRPVLNWTICRNNEN